MQAVVYREAYAGPLPDEVVAQFEPRVFTNAWRDSLTNAPSRDHLLLVACAGEQVVGLAAVGPSTDPDGQERPSSSCWPCTRGTPAGARLAPAQRRGRHGPRARPPRADRVGARCRRTTARAFLTAAGLEADGAHRERVVDADGTTAREVRLSAGLAPEAE